LEKKDLNKQIKEKLKAINNNNSWFSKNIIYEPMKKVLMSSSKHKHYVII
jgi:hypothetical protein